MSRRTKKVDPASTTPQAVNLAWVVEQKPGHTLIVVLLFFVFGFGVYSNTFRAPFEFDDGPAILENVKIRKLWPLWQVLTPPRDTTVAGRPILSLSLALNYALSGHQVWSYHLFNIALHFLAALSLFGIVRRTLRSPQLQDRFQASSFALAFIISSLWLVHPLQTESVTYIIQRAESLVGLFFLLTLYSAIRGFEGSWPKAWLSAAVVFCTLGMATKEVMASAPLLVLLYDRSFVSGSFRGAWLRARAFYVCLGLTWLLLAGLVAANPRGHSVSFAFTDVTPYRYTITQAQVLLHYLRLGLWPSDLCFYYDWPVLTSLRLALPSLIPLSALLALTFWALVQRPPFGFLGVWFFAILAPSSSIVPIATEVAAEHRMYLPLAAVISAVVIGGFLWITRLPSGNAKRSAGRSGLKRFWEMALVGFAVLLLGFQTYRRNEDYRDGLTLWGDTVLKQPWNSVAHGNLASALTHKHLMDEALAHYREAVRLHPDNVDGLLGVANCLVELGKPQEAIPYNLKALKIRPDDAHTQCGVSRPLIALGRIDEAMDHLRNALRINPNMVEALNHMGIAFGMKGKTEEAIALYRKAIRLQPSFVEAYNNLGNVLLGQRKFQEALGKYSEAARIDPEDPKSHANVAAAQFALGNYADSWREIKLCRQAGGQPPERLLSLLTARMPEPR